MQRFFFDVRGGNAWTVDAAGEVFADDESASEAALDIIQSVARDERRQSGTQEFAIRVRDEAGCVTFEAAFSWQRQDASTEV